MSSDVYYFLSQNQKYQALSCAAGMPALEEHEFKYGIGRTKHTFYLAAGPQDGPLLIFIHGWPAIARTWKQSLNTFASLGFRAMAPDMPGYGRSTMTKNAEDYALENINLAMVALLEHLGREEAVWIGHDWGCGAVWSFAAHYPEKCVGVVGLTVPYRTLELGLEELLKYVNRDIYPIEDYPYGQFSYMKFYEESFEKATEWFEADIPGFVRLGYRAGDPASYRKPAGTANVTRDGGWAGGIPKPDPNWKHIPLSRTILDEETYAELVAALEKTGFWGADAWYSNHQRNREYSLRKWKNDGYLHMPVLFIEAQFDAVCDTSVSRLSEPMRKYCTNLTECSIDAGHWVAQEKPGETNAAIARWLVESCKTYWPGYWSNAHVKNRPLTS